MFELICFLIVFLTFVARVVCQLQPKWLGCWQMSSGQVTSWKWLRNGDVAFAAMLDAIDRASSSIRFETYIYTNDEVGRRFREALTRAAQRGVNVRVLVDAIGSLGLA